MRWKEKNYMYLENLLTKMQPLSLDYLLLQALYSLEKKETITSVEYLDKAISIEPSLYKAYLDKADILFHMDIKESFVLSTKALYFASNYKEVSAAISKMFSLECQDEVMKYT